MGGAGVGVAALGAPQQAAALAPDRVERLDDAEQWQPVGVARQPEPAPLAAGGSEHAFPGQPVECLGEIVARHPQPLGDLLDVGGLAGIGQEEHRPEGVFGGPGQHDTSPAKRKKPFTTL